MTRSALAVAVTLATLLVAVPAASAHAILLRAEPTAFGRGYTDLVVLIALFKTITVIALRTRQRWLGIAAVVVGVVALLVPGLVGHPGQGSVPALAVPLDWLHLCAAATCAGGLLVVTTLPPPGRGATTQIAAAGDVATVVPTGVAPDPDGPEAGEPTPPPALNVRPVRSLRRCSRRRRTSASSRSIRTAPGVRTT